MYYGHSFVDTAPSAILVLRIICSVLYGTVGTKLHDHEISNMGITRSTKMSNTPRHDILDSPHHCYPLVAIIVHGTGTVWTNIIYMVTLL